jgi:hypothetical protein
LETGRVFVRTLQVVTTDMSLRSRVLAAASTVPSATRTQGRRKAALLLAASLAVAITIFEQIGGLAHSAGRPIGTTVLLSGGWMVVSLVLTWLVLGGKSTLARRPALVVAAALVAPIVVFAWTHLLHGTYAEPFQRFGWRCLAYSLGVTALPLAAFLSLKRAVEPRHPSALGAAAGATCACWAGALIDLWCPLTDPMHVLIGHVTPLVVAIAVGALVGRWTLGVRLVHVR